MATVTYARLEKSDGRSRDGTNKWRPVVRCSDGRAWQQEFDGAVEGRAWLKLREAECTAAPRRPPDPPDRPGDLGYPRDGSPPLDGSNPIPPPAPPAPRSPYAPVPPGSTPSAPLPTTPPAASPAFSWLSRETAVGGAPVWIVLVGGGLLLHKLKLL